MKCATICKWGRWLAPVFILVACVVVLSLAAGCASLQPETVVQTRTVTTEVKVPVPIPCINRADLPALPAATFINVESAKTDQKAAATAADAEQFERYARAVAALLDQCVQTGGVK